MQERVSSAYDNLELLLVKAWLGADNYSFFELLLKLLKAASLLIVQEVGHLGMNREHHFIAMYIKHFAPKFTEELMANGNL